MNKRDDIIGFKTPQFSVEVEKGRLRLFAKASGESNPVYSHEQAAQAAGYRSLPVPPTFFFCLEMEREDPYDWFHTLAIPLGQVLHAGQSFQYFETACAGDIVHFSGDITEHYFKKEGALEFITHRNLVTSSEGSRVAEFDRRLVIRHPRSVQ